MTGVGLKPFAGLTAAVLLAHLAALQVASDTLQAQQRVVTRPFITRSIALNQAAPTPASTSAVAAVPVPVPVRVRKPAPRPVAVPTSLPNSTPEAPGAPASVAAAPGFDPSQAGASNTAEEIAQAPAPAASAAAPAQAVATAPPGAPAAPAASASPPSPVGAIAYTLPGSMRLKYNVKGTKDNLNYNARAEMLWLQDGSTYEARLEVSAFLIGARTRTSTGRLTADGLLPTRFADKFRTEVAAHFERDKDKVSFSANTPDLPLLPGMQDQLSVFVQLGAMLAGEPAKYPSGTNISFETIGPRSGETWVITVDGEEKLDLPGGEINAIKLSRKPRREFDQTAELWLAPALGYLPVRIKITEKNGDFVDQVWRATEAP